LYGCGTLLIREAKARWNLQVSIIFLAVAYGILEEGLMIQSFFNIAHVDLDNLSGYGMFLGVQWPWTIMLILFHATISTLVPIVIADLLWPKYRNKPLLKKRGLMFSFIGLTLVVIIWMVFVIGKKFDLAYIHYHPNNLLIISSLVIVLLLIWLAYKYKNSRLSTNKIILFSPFIFAIAGFLFLIGQIYHKDITKLHIVSLIFGSIFFWILITFILEFNGIFGMSIVGIITLILLIIWGKIVLKNNVAL
jgi:hypothetical protein